MTDTTRRLLENSVVVDCAIPPGVTLAEYRRSQPTGRPKRRRLRHLGRQRP